ncbi:WYL domain-containing protein [Herpetosiphon sp.]|uniref:Helix-turn-helix type 11 domain protein n=1 Tax=Herpetosiphon aurantiacus (strain ATCC 23779 / DSM 785 / 114-95) TaxID=316274 RepID=A9AWW0_HERA2|nr:WYL domain-containing protein [Herpetosiphon sp.]ABX03361.1 Helix-turn-helix type 11 domain protein [Herpetosiphon aurantiacus DSM 785]
MYSPTTRLLTILELLQSHQRMRGAELASRLEISQRTVRRYVVMLQDMGIPVEAERGPDGAYYLGRGYTIPPLMINPTEALALVLGLRMIHALQFPVDATAIEGAIAKLERVMPTILLDQVRAFQEAITFHVAPPPALLQPSIVASLSVAVHTRQQVWLSYQTYNGDASVRVFDPYGIVYYQGYWYSVGYCHQRNDLRTFRIDRIQELKLLNQSFERPQDFDALHHMHTTLATMAGPYAVEIVFAATMEQVRHVLPPAAGTFEQSEVGIIWRRETYELTSIAHRLLQIDLPATIRQPSELKAMMHQLAAKALGMTLNQHP